MVVKQKSRMVDKGAGGVNGVCQVSAWNLQLRGESAERFQMWLREYRDQNLRFYFFF